MRFQWSVSVAVGLILWATGGLTADFGTVRTGAILETETAVSTRNKRAQKTELILDPELDWRLPGGDRLFAKGRLRGDALDRLEPGEPDQPGASRASRRHILSDHVEVDLREFYLDLRLGGTYLRAGKQSVVWGQADGLKVLDVVNPQSFREFILDDFDDSRIPLWTLNGEIPTDPGTLQVLWIPDRTYNDLPEAEDLFALSSPLLVPQPMPGVPVTVQAPRRPDRFVADSDAGLRWSVFRGGWDLSLNYLYHYHDNPVPFLRRNPGGITVEPRYRRTHLLGATVSRALGDVVLRGEGGYSTHRYFIASDPADPDGVVRTQELSYVFGLDWQAPRDVFLSGQIFQSVLAPDADPTVRRDVQTDVTGLARRSFWYDTLTTELLVVHNLNVGDGLIEADLGWEYRTNLTVSVGADVFYGPARGRFGQFDRLDRVTLSLEMGI